MCRWARRPGWAEGGTVTGAAAPGTRWDRCLQQSPRFCAQRLQVAAARRGGSSLRSPLALCGLRGARRCPAPGGSVEPSPPPGLTPSAFFPPQHRLAPGHQPGRSGVFRTRPRLRTRPHARGPGWPCCSSSPNTSWGKGPHARCLPSGLRGCAPPPSAPPPLLPRPTSPARRCPGNHGARSCRRREAGRSSPRCHRRYCHCRRHRAPALTPALTPAPLPCLLGQPCHRAAPRRRVRSCCPPRPCCCCCCSARGPAAAAWPARCPPRRCPLRGLAPRSPAGMGASAPRAPRLTLSPRLPSANPAIAAPAPPGSPAPIAR